MKRILGVLLALVLLCTACPVSAESANAMDALLEQLDKEGVLFHGEF